MSNARASGRRVAKPGAALKDLRTERGWTLADLAGRTGLPVSTLSKMENGKTALTFDKLINLSEALDVDITALFAPGTAALPRADGATRRSIARAGDGEAIDTSRGNYLYLAAELLRKRFTPIVGEVLAKDIATYGPFSKHEGEEFVYVLEGTLELHTEMYTPAILGVGDSVFFDSGMLHAYIASGDDPCRILSICATQDPHFGSLINGEGHRAEEAAGFKRLAKRSKAPA